MGRTAREVLNELKWREGRDLAEAEIWIADRTRPAGGRVLRGSEIRSIEGRYLTTEGATIPLYKVLRIVLRGEILFDRAPQTSRTGGEPGRS